MSIIRLGKYEVRWKSLEGADENENSMANGIGNNGESFTSS